MTIPGNLLLSLIGTLALAAQGQTPAVKVYARAPGANTDGSAVQSDYLLGPGDQIVVRVLDAEAFNEKPLQIDMSGFIRLPEVGRIHVGGLTVSQVEADVAGRLMGLLLHPDVQVSIAEFHSQPVSVIGS